MNERDPELFEAELCRLKPAPLPCDLQARLANVRPMGTAQAEIRRPSGASASGGWLWLRWLTPATVALLAVLVVVFQGGTHRNPAPPAISAPAPALKADQVEIDQQLVGSFDTVAEMPDGEPVRMRVNQWMDEVTLRDSASGVEVVQRTPRIKVVPVSFTVY
jgi:hypothetical protein